MGQASHALPLACRMGRKGPILVHWISISGQIYEYAKVVAEELMGDFTADYHAVILIDAHSVESPSIIEAYQCSERASSAAR